MTNVVALVGRLVKDVELTYTSSGVALGKFTLAVNRAFKKDGDQEADFIRIVTFRKTAENTANFCKKGSQVAVTGRIQTGSYEGQDGKRIYTTDVIADNVQFLDTRSQSDTTQGGYQQSQQPQQQRQGSYNNSSQSNTPFSNSSVDVSEDSLPF